MKIFFCSYYFCFYQYSDTCFAYPTVFRETLRFKSLSKCRNLVEWIEWACSNCWSFGHYRSRALHYYQIGRSVVALNAQNFSINWQIMVENQMFMVNVIWWETIPFLLSFFDLNFAKPCNFCFYRWKWKKYCSPTHLMMSKGHQLSFIWGSFKVSTISYRK